MLILRRRQGESLLIGDEVEIQVLEAGPWGVKVGIHAPRGITILRKELRMVREANCAAARQVEVGELAKTLRIFSGMDSHKGQARR
jgi:carbon storage regulator